MGKKKPTTKLERAKMISGMNTKKVAVDKTFGMKNKKGGKAQKEIAIMQMGANAASEQKARMKQKLREKKAQDLADAKMLGMGFAKPKKLTFKQKLAAKARAEEEKQSQKRDMYTDERDEEAEAKAADSMDTWDQDKLDSVIALKASKDPSNDNAATRIVCKHFLKAVEGMKYGWFWECPSGKECKYKHALPKGFVLKRDQEEDTEVKISMEQLIEEERQALLKKVLPGKTLTKVTVDSFKEWKKRKIMEKKRKEVKARKKLKGKIAAGKTVVVTGRQMFSMGVAKGTEGAAAKGGDADGGGDFDLAAMKKAKGAAMDDALAAAAAGGAPADDSGAKDTKKVDDMFNMDLGDMAFNEDDVSSDEEVEESAVPAAGGGGGGAAAATGGDDAAPSILPSGEGDEIEAAAAMALRLNLLDANDDEEVAPEEEVIPPPNIDEAVALKAGRPNCSHGLTKDKVDASMDFWCDICDQVLKVGTLLYGCQECDYDACYTCKTAIETKCWSDHAAAVAYAASEKASAGAAAAASAGAGVGAGASAGAGAGGEVHVDADLFDGEDLDGIDLDGLDDDDED